MEQLDPHIEDLIIEYLSGTISTENNRQLNAWLQGNPANQDILRRCREIWMTTKAEHQATDYDWRAGFAKFNKRKQEQQRSAESKKQRHIFSFVRYAAVLLIAVSLAAVICYRQGRHSWMGQLSDVSMNVPMGSTMSLSLPDGTQVSLNGGSTLSYPQSFGLKNRKVELSGEAYFAIVHHTDQPIEIHTSKMTVRDIGTKLNITNYPEDNQARVVIDEGSIELKTGNDTQASIIVAGQEAIIDKRSGHITIANKQSDGNAWSKGELIFHNTTVADIAKRLERTYNIDISIHHPATANKRFYGTFSTHEQSYTDILQALKETGTLRYTIKGKHIDIY
uniref:FecR family protein n=1 Tax=Prevotella sp. TaxID=59823 RepID=UPI004029F118